MIKLRYGTLLFLLLLVHYCVYASEITTTCISQKEEVGKALPQFTFEEIGSFFIDRHGSVPESYMVTKGLNSVLRNKVTYQLTFNGFKQVDGVGELLKPTKSFDPPSYRELEGIWDTHKIEDGTGANILGQNSSFILKSRGTELQVPVVTATDKALAYYNARLIKVGDLVQFPLTENFPIMVMEVGENYVNDYLMKVGGGFYIEHHNQPLLHMPMDKDAGGFYLLGKKVGEYQYRFTAFRIPFGFAVFTNNNVIHCDAGLVGNYLVGYTITKEYSTVLMRSGNMERVKVVAA